MLKFQPAIATAVATLLVVPAATLGEREIDSLESMVRDTVRAIEVLTNLQERAQADEPGIAALVVSVTEPPILDERARDERLETLRNEVNLLQTELDLIEHRTVTNGGPVVGAPMAIGTAAEPIPPVESGREAITTGLDPARLQALGPPAVRSVAEPDVPTDPAVGVPAATSGATEEEGYSADPMRHARACFLAGRYAEGLMLLEQVEDEPLALYWRARCLERLERMEEAIELLEGIMDELPTGYTAQRAKQELEFFRWKRDFLAKLPDRSGPADASGGTSAGEEVQ